MGCSPDAPKAGTDPLCIFSTFSPDCLPSLVSPSCDVDVPVDPPSSVVFSF